MLLLAYWVVLPVALALLAALGLMLHVWWTYCPIIVRMFEETPVFAPLRVPASDDGEEVSFPTTNNLRLAGSYFPTLTEKRLGVVLFCPEYLGDRWSFKPYTDGLREAGFDVFTFDFRNHGDSETDTDYLPMQWVSDLELVDIEAAMNYLANRPDRDPAGVALFGVSRGGGAALCVAAANPAVWAVVTDGAFPTRGTMLAYILRWASIPCKSQLFLRFAPRWIYAFAGWTGRKTSEIRRGRFHPNLERAVSRISPRPWLMIHGQKDAYISPEIAQSLYDHAREPREAWIVPGAKHNRCRESSPALYRERLVDFLQRYAPRHTGVLTTTATSAEARNHQQDAATSQTTLKPDRSTHVHLDSASSLGLTQVEEEIAAR